MTYVDTLRQLVGPDVPEWVIDTLAGDLVDRDISIAQVTHENAQLHARVERLREDNLALHREITSRDALG